MLAKSWSKLRECENEQRGIRIGDVNPRSPICARIFAGTSSLIELGNRAAARICPEKQIEFMLRHDALDATEIEMSKESHCNE